MHVLYNEGKFNEKTIRNIMKPYNRLTRYPTESTNIEKILNENKKIWIPMGSLNGSITKLPNGVIEIY